MIYRYLAAVALPLVTLSGANAATTAISQSVDLKADLRTGSTPTIELQRFNPAFGELQAVYFDLKAYASGFNTLENISYSYGDVGGESYYTEYVFSFFVDEQNNYEYMASETANGATWQTGGSTLEGLISYQVGPKTVVTDYGSYINSLGGFYDPFHSNFVGLGAMNAHFNVYYGISYELFGFDVPGYARTKFTLQDLGIKGKITYYFNPVPEPATWMMMVVGFGAVGSMIRRQHRTARATPS